MAIYHPQSPAGQQKKTKNLRHYLNYNLFLPFTKHLATVNIYPLAPYFPSPLQAHAPHHLQHNEVRSAPFHDQDPTLTPSKHHCPIPEAILRATGLQNILRSRSDRHSLHAYPVTLLHVNIHPLRHRNTTPSNYQGPPQVQWLHCSQQLTHGNTGNHPLPTILVPNRCQP